MAESSKTRHKVQLQIKIGCKRKRCTSFCDQCIYERIELYFNPQNPRIADYLDVLLNSCPPELTNVMTASGFLKEAQEYRDKLRYNVDGIFGEGAADAAFKYGLESAVAYKLACNVRDVLEKQSKRRVNKYGV